jgi:hypothetical protein
MIESIRQGRYHAHADRARRHPAGLNSASMRCCRLPAAWCFLRIGRSHDPVSAAALLVTIPISWHLFCRV